MWFPFVLLQIALAQDVVYLAGPLFNHHERLEMERIDEAVRTAGFATFLPHRDGFLLADLQPYLVERYGWTSRSATERLARAVDALDVYQVLERTNALVLNLNGRVPDEGAIAEAAMAWMMGHPVVAYRDDVRTLTNGIVNPLVAGRADFTEVHEILQIPAALNARMGGARATYEAPTPVQTKLAEGRTLWDRLESARKLDPERRLETIASAVRELYGCAGNL